MKSNIQLVDQNKIQIASITIEKKNKITFTFFVFVKRFHI